MLVLEIALAVSAVLALVYVLIACVCGCRNNQQKASAQNSQRSLPEIPQPVARHDSNDTASELIYATLNIEAGGTEIAAATSTSHHHSYEHAYAKVQNENIQRTGGVEQTPGPQVVLEPEAPTTSAPDGYISEAVVISASVAIAGQLPSSQELPYMTPPSPPHLPALLVPPEHPPHPVPAAVQQNFSGDSTDSAKGYTSISVREPLSNIRALTRGRQLYATVSDDSDEMYAAIDDHNSASGGSDTYAQIAPVPTSTPSPAAAAPAPVAVTAHASAAVTAHASAAVAASASAAVAASATAAAFPTPADAALHPAAELIIRRSTPPEAAAAAAAAVPNHTRQASTWSVSGASGGALGSPKPEKRQANSPLPPPPGAGSSTGDLQASQDKQRRSLNEKHQRNNSCVSSSDFYGCNYPVEKHRFSSGELVRPLAAKEFNFDMNQSTTRDNLCSSIHAPTESLSAEVSLDISDHATESPARNIEEMYAKVMKKNKKLQLSEDKPHQAYGNENSGEADPSLRFTNEDPGYETIDRKRSLSHGYETITNSERKYSPRDTSYETLRASKDPMKSAHLNRDSGPNSILTDAGYEKIAKGNSCPSDCDPNYEVLSNQPPTPPYATVAPNYNIPTYSTVSKHQPKGDMIVEPNYESMPHDGIYTTGSESDPNYESVRPKESNYESMSVNDANYDSLISKTDPKYESVRSKVSASKHPYETLANDPNYESVKYAELRRSDSAAGYERIRAAPSNGEGSTVEDYFQV